MRNIISIILSACLIWACETRMSTSLENSQNTVPEVMFDYSNTDLSYQIDTFFEKRYKAKRFNGVVLFAQDGKVVHHKVYGFSNFRTKDSLNIGDAFQLASVSKPLTAIAVLKLIENEQLNLEDTLQKFFPNFPYEGITVRHLLSHRSGLANYMYFIDEIWENKDSSITNSQMLALMERDTPKIYYAPDVRYHYCNTNFALLANIIEKVSNLTYEEFLQKEIFTPLKMTDTYIYNRNNQRQIPQEVIGHNAYLRPKDNIYLNGVVGDKGVYASALDLFRLDQALYEENFIKQELLNVAFSPHNPDLTRRNRDNYGLGWRIQKPSKFGKVVYHGGWWKGFKTYYIRMLDKNQTIVVLTNTTRGGYLDRFAMQELFEIDENVLEIDDF